MNGSSQFDKAFLHRLLPQRRSEDGPSAVISQTGDVAGRKMGRRGASESGVIFACVTG